MKIERFQLQGFAQHRDLTVSFRDGAPNLILGPNEAGKSHLMTGLLGTLYGIPNPGPYIPWHGEPVMTGWLRFLVGEDAVEIQRLFLEQKVEVWVNDVSIYTGRGLVERNTAEDERYHGLLHEWLGFAEPKVFERTVFVGQDLLLDERLGDFSSQIKRVITGTQEANYETAIRDLESELDKLKLTGMARKPRLLEQLQERLRDLDGRYQEAEQVQTRVVALIAEERQLQETIDQAAETQRQYSTLVEQYGRYQEYAREEKDAREDWADLHNRLDELNAARERRAGHEQRRDQLRIPDDPTPEEIRRLIGDIERTTGRIEHLEREVERNEEIRVVRQRLQQQLAELSIPDNVDPSEIQRLGWQIERLEGEVNNLNQRIEQERDAPPPQRAEPETGMSSGTRGALLATSALIAVVSIALGILVDPVMFVVLLVAVVPLYFALRSGRSRDISETSQPERDPREERIRELQGNLNTANEELEKLTGQRNAILDSTGLTSLDEVVERVNQRQQVQVRLNAQAEVNEQPAEDLRKARETLEQLEAKRAGLFEASGEPDLDALVKRAEEYSETVRLLGQLETISNEDIEDLTDRITEARQNAGMAEDRKKAVIESHPGIDQLPADQIEAYRRAVDSARESEREAEDRVREVRFQRRQLAQGADDAAALQVEINELKSEIERVELRADAHELAIETLRASVREFQESALDPVAENAARYFMSITDGRYHGVELDRDRMTPVVSGNGLSEIDFARLSRGAKDQLYLSIRAALIDALSGDRDLPMVLDDPCVHFDDGRLEATAELIGKLARDRQILLFTKDETWSQWFDPVLRLQRQDSVIPT